MPSASQRGSSRLSTNTPATSTPTDDAAEAAATPTTAAVRNKSPSSSAASVSSSSRSGFFSRLNLPPINLPLRSRNRNLADFHIRPDEPHKQYSIGDSVRGSVVLAIAKPVRITHLVVALHGYVQVYKDPAAAARGQITSVPPRGGVSNKAQYHGSGIASLFQDEQVLSGEGRLEPGRYEFGFDLMFPKKNLPSSIDFERGTVSYMITATLTRPTAIAPTSTCERRVLLAERIDIGQLRAPRPRTIFLEPMAKKSKKKRTQAGLERTATATHDGAGTEVGSEVDSTEQSQATDESVRDYRQVEHRNGADGRSEISAGSSRSVSTGLSRYDGVAASSSINTGITSPAKQQVVDNKTITASIEILKAGYLPGDTVTVKISIQHIKRVKSMSGIIVTLYRQCRIDSSPPASAFSGRGNRNIDEAYPSSRASLAGMALSSTSSRSVFRKDLDQNTAPLITDPNTLYTTIKLSLKIPDDCFPTMKSVPGGMITFKYMVEVLLDLGGRLSSQVMQVAQPAGRLGQQTGALDPSINAYGARLPSAILDTSAVRPQKGVISLSMETIVGTVDVARTRKPPTDPNRRIIRLADGEEVEVISPDANNRAASGPFAGSSSPATHAYQPRYPSPPPPLRIPSESSAPGPSQPAYPEVNGYRHTQEAAPAYIPPPQVQDQQSMTEKERVRQAETRLLPSQPPGAAASGSGSGLAPDEDDIYGYDSQDTPRPPYAAPTFSPIEESDAGPSAPTEQDVTSTTYPTEDKQELERRRLIGEASAPPEVPDDIERSSAAGSSSNITPDAEPSAPALPEEDGYGHDDVSSGPSGNHDYSNASGSSAQEQLPAYRR